MDPKKALEFDVNEADLVFVDCEFTGLKLLTHEIIEIGLVKAKAKTYEIIGQENILIKPENIENANSQALEINGYNEKEWADAVDLKTGLETFLSYTNGVMLVGHNLTADWMQLKKSIEQAGLTENYYYKGLDTFSLAWQKLGGHPGFQRYSLTELAAFFKIDQGDKHRALADAKTTYKVFLKLLEYES